MHLGKSSLKYDVKLNTGQEAPLDGLNISASMNVNTVWLVVTDELSVAINSGHGDSGQWWGQWCPGCHGTWQQLPRMVTTQTSIQAFPPSPILTSEADLFYRVSSKTVYTWFLPFFWSKSNPILTSRVSFEN